MAGTARRNEPREAGEEGILRTPDGTPYLSPRRAGAFLGLVRAGDALGRELDSELQREHDLSLRAFEILLFLTVFAPDGQMRIGDLAENAPLSQSQVSRLVSELESRGLITRTTASNDARGVEVAVTATGRAKFRQAQETHLRGLEERLFSRLTDEEVRQLASITRKILEGR